MIDHPEGDCQSYVLYFSKLVRLALELVLELEPLLEIHFPTDMGEVC